MNSDKIDNIFLVIIPLLIWGAVYGRIPIWIVLAALLIRLLYTDRHTVGIFLLMFGGILGSTIRFEIPGLPIYGLMLNFLGIVLIWDLFKYFKTEKSSIQSMIIVLLFFLLSFLLSQNTNDYGATNKIVAILQNGLIMLFCYYAIISTPKFDNESISQCLFLLVILFLVHNMNLLGIKPHGLFDYEWQRKGGELFFMRNNDELYHKFVNYQVVGMNALYGVCLYISQLHFNKYKAIFYSIIGLQLVLSSGARQAIFGLLIIIVLRYIFFNENSIQEFNIAKKVKYMVIGLAIGYVLLLILQTLNLGYINDTLSEGDLGRDRLRLMGWNLFLKYPIFGTGIGGFNHAYPGMLYPHNLIIELLCECGVFGVLFLLYMIIRHFRKQQMNLLFLTRNNSFLFLILAVLGIRMMVSDSLGAGVELFSAIFACSITAREVELDS